MADRCEIRGCRAPVDLVYLDHGICTPHWEEFTGNDASPEALKVVLGIDGRGPETEEEGSMSTEQEATPAEAATAKEDTMKAKSKTPKATTKKAAAAKPEKKATRKREPKERVELRTLALRVTNDEFDLVHKAAGPRNLTGFMKTAVMTAAQRFLSK